METQCKLCGYKWNTKSKFKYVSCPSCMGKTQIRDTTWLEDNTQLNKEEQKNENNTKNNELVQTNKVCANTNVQETGDAGFLFKSKEEEK